jgi:hypothetical protein
VLVTGYPSRQWRPLASAPAVVPGPAPDGPRAAGRYRRRGLPSRRQPNPATSDEPRGRGSVDSVLSWPVAWKLQARVVPAALAALLRQPGPAMRREKGA